MDIHRCRFVPYRPHAINAVSFSHPSDLKESAPRDLRLAIGRANGDIELWNPAKGQWYQEKICYGSEKRVIEQLAWTRDLHGSDTEDSDGKPEYGPPRLFSSGGSSSITEWNVVLGQPIRHAQCNAGDIWCFAVQPQWKRSDDRTLLRGTPSQLLAAGCSNGTVVLFKTSDDDLQYDRVLAQPPHKKAKVISIAWRDRNTVVIGYDRSVIRVVDIRNRSVIRDMSLGQPLDGTHNLVWALKCLPDGTILSGDSSGELKTWDARNFSLVQRIRAHEADILDIATNEKGDMIYTCGIDRRTVLYRPLPARSDVKGRRWQQVHHRRFHQHDVKAVSTFESKDLSVVVSGGMDSTPVLMPLRNWNNEHHRVLSHLPRRPQMSVSSTQKLILSWWDREIQLWSFPSGSDFKMTENSNMLNTNGSQLLARLQIATEENIVSAAINSSGTLILASTSSTTRLFQVRKSVRNGTIQVRARQVELPKGLRSFGAKYVGFSPDGKWICAIRLSNLVTLAKVTKNVSAKEMPQINQKVIKLDRTKRENAYGVDADFARYLQHISSVAFSSDSRVIAVGDLSGRIDSWILEGHEAEEQEESTNKMKSDSVSDSSSESDSEDESDSFVIHGQKWIRPPNGGLLPRMDSAILCLTFKPSSESAVNYGHVNGNIGLHATRHTPHPVSHEVPAATSALLWVVTAGHDIFEIDIIASRLTEWSRRNPSKYLPQNFRIIKDPVMGAWWDCNTSKAFERLWLYGSTWIFMLDVSQDLESASMQQSMKIERIGDHEVTTPVTQQISAIEDGPMSYVVNGKRKRNNGAGDEMHRLKKHSASIPPGTDGNISNNTNENENLNDEDEFHELVALRRQVNGHINQSASEEAVKQNLAHWQTFQYRSILGACCLRRSKPHEMGDENIEVVIVERPLHDIEFAPRFAGGQDWNDWQK